MGNSEDKTEYKSPGGDTDQFAEYQVYGEKYPTAEEALFRLAIDKVLTLEQKKIWEYWNYDKLTQKKIADKLKSEQSLIAKKIKTIEKQLTQWCKEHMEVYNLLKEID